MAIPYMIYFIYKAYLRALPRVELSEASAVRTQRSWQRRAVAGAGRHGAEQRGEGHGAERLQGILDRAAEYLALDEVRKGAPQNHLM